MRPAIYGEVVPELEDVVFKIKIGETVGPVRSKFRLPHPAQGIRQKAHFHEAEEPNTKGPREAKARPIFAVDAVAIPVEVLDAQFN